MEIASLASGSSGNCFFVSQNNQAILVDAGISSKKIHESLSQINQDPQAIKGVFITHEHSDHIKGVDVFARKYHVPIFATKKTIQNSFICSDESLINEIKNNESFLFAGFLVQAFSKSHKAADPVSFSISNKKKNLSIITDAGKACKNIASQIASSDFLCLESNHDPKMLQNGPYPYFLKQWIKSDTGHLSNLQASLAVLEHADKKLKHVLLSHLSESNNTPNLAFKTFKNIIKERSDLFPEVSISPRHLPTSLFKI